MSYRQLRFERVRPARAAGIGTVDMQPHRYAAMLRMVASRQLAPAGLISPCYGWAARGRMNEIGRLP